jgi:hypothetical protein
MAVVAVSPSSEVVDVRALRIDMVRAWQRHYGMEPRDDSRLTWLFADGLVAMPADMVARELLATDYIYKRTLYGELIQSFLRRVADALRTEHPKLSWKATWDIVRFYGPIALKLMCVAATGERIPDRMPADAEAA